jgi:E3 ubiquitin-protein ligase BRE1
LDRNLEEALTKLNNLQKLNANLSNNSNNNSNNNNNSNEQNSKDKVNNLTEKQLKDFESNLEEQREIAASRLQELEKLNIEYQASLRQIERLKADLKTIPESIIEQSNEYKILQAKYSLIVNDNIKIKQALDETRQLVEMSRTTFQRQLETMESEELMSQKRLGNEMMHTEEQLTQIRKENDLLRIEYEQNVAANEQTGPINKEMRSLITTLQTKNKLVNSDNLRTKKRLEEVQLDVDRLKKQNSQLQAQLQAQMQHQTAAVVSTKPKAESVNNINEQVNVKSEALTQVDSSNSSTSKIPSSKTIEQNETKPSSSPINKTNEATSPHNNNKKVDESSKVKVELKPPTQDSSTPSNDKCTENNQINEKVIKDLQEENKKLLEHQNDTKNLLEILSKSSTSSLSSSSSSLLSASNNSNKNVSPSPSSTSSTASNSKNCSSHHHLHRESVQQKNSNLTELEESKIEIKRLRECLERFKSKTLLPAQQIPINSPFSISSSSPASSSSNSAASHRHHRDLTEEKLNSSSISNDQHLKKIRVLEDQIRELHKSLSNKKQEEAALLNDMEITGQAFEEMQEQNVRLMQQLREKDDANFKLVSERIKLENVQKILKEEKEIYVQQIQTLQEQQEAQMNISKKLEEQHNSLTQTVTIREKEILLQQQNSEIYKRHAIDNVQLIQDLKINTQKYLFQLKEAQQQIAEKSELLASQSFNTKRAQEEIKHLHLKLERQKKFEMASNIDEVLKEEIKEYKEQLRCPSCKVKQKDAVLTKCFHVFCFDCLQKRYDTRQRKCPKCNAGFGANDFRKLYLS